MPAAAVLTRRRTVALTIAGFDPSSGAGISADLMTFAAHGLFGTAAITALTVQSTTGIEAVRCLGEEWIGRTLRTLVADLPPAGIKIGMLGSVAAVRAISGFLQKENLGDFGPVVLDPVLRASSGRELLERDGVELLKDQLLPQVDWVTPNWAELAILAQRPVGSLSEAAAAAQVLGRQFPRLRIVATGGDAAIPVDLLRTPDGELREFAGQHVETESTHGTGCAFSSALLSRLLLGDGPVEAVRSAKTYVEGALRHAPGLGQGRGPMGLLWTLLDP